MSRLRVILVAVAIALACMCRLAIADFNGRCQRSIEYEVLLAEHQTLQGRSDTLQVKIADLDALNRYLQLESSCVRAVVRKAGSL